MAQQRITFSSILDGQSPTQYFASANSYLKSIAIDPDMPISGNYKASGCIVPVVYEEFSGAALTGYPKWIITNIKDTNVYTYSSDGTFISYSSVLGTETALTTPTSGAGNGACYYDNYIYLATPTDVARYGPLNGSPALVQTVWSGATLGSNAVTTNTTFPTISGLQLPNHVMHVHGDNSVYFSDVVSGAGVLHRIKTRKTTVEGDTNDGSTFNVLDLPFGWLITDIDSWGLDVAILAIQTTSAAVDQGKAALFLWDPTNVNTFYAGPIYLPDPLGTSLMNVNGHLYIWSGNSVGGCRLSEYLGGNSISEIAFIEDGKPPMAGACESDGGRILWGMTVADPEAATCVMAYGSKSNRLAKALHNIIRTTSAGANGICTAIKMVQQGDLTTKIVVGSGDDSAKQLDKYSTTGTYDSIWRSNIVSIGAGFSISKIRIPLGAALAANMAITPKVYYDDASTSKTLNVINTTNFTSGARKIIYNQGDIKSDSINPKNNFFIELAFAGTVNLPITFPIEVVVDVREDEGND